MFRRHWRESAFWQWLWHERINPEAKLLIGAVVIGLMLAGGWFAADRLSSASARVWLGPSVHAGDDGREVDDGARARTGRSQACAGGEEVLVLKTTTDVRTRTAVQTKVVTNGGGVRTVHTTVVVRVPVVSKKVLTINGKRPPS